MMSAATNCDDGSGTGIGTCACGSDLCNAALTVRATPSSTVAIAVLCSALFGVVPFSNHF